MSIRRLVTGVDEHGRSTVTQDGPTPGHIELGRATYDELWASESLPPSLTGVTDPADVEHAVLAPVSGGVKWRVVTFAPVREVQQLTDEQVAEAREHFDDDGVMRDYRSGWHTTHSIDFAVVLSGEIDLHLDTQTVRLHAGDSIVQRGTAHAWSNPGTEPCAISFVLISADPPPVQLTD